MSIGGTPSDTLRHGGLSLARRVFANAIVPHHEGPIELDPVHLFTSHYGMNNGRVGTMITSPDRLALVAKRRL